MSTSRTIRHQLRRLSIGLQRLVRSIARPVTRIFGPTDDQYPATGVQPFSGEPFDPKHSRKESS